MHTPGRYVVHLLLFLVSLVGLLDRADDVRQISVRFVSVLTDRKGRQDEGTDRCITSIQPIAIRMHYVSNAVVSLNALLSYIGSDLKTDSNSVCFRDAPTRFFEANNDI